MSDPTAPAGRGPRRMGRAPRLPLSYVAVLVVCACLGGATGMAVLTRLGWLPSVPLLPPSATPSLTLPPTLTPSLTPSPSPSPTDTPIPPARVEAADAALAAGDWPRALAEYAAVQANTADPALLAAAALGQGLAHLKAGAPQAAIAALTTFIAVAPDSPSVAEAQFILGDAYRAAGQWPEALAAYAAYLALRPNTLDAYAQAGRAQAAIALGDYATAVAALQAAIAAPRSGDSFDLQEQLAEVYATLGDVENAVATYDAVYQATDQNWRKARAAVKAGQVLYADGQTDAAYAKFLDAVNNYPEAAATFDGLLVLVNDGVPVDDLQRGLTNYYADNYEPARDALLRYHAAYGDGAPSPSAPGDPTALYHLGLTYAALQDPPAAISAWRELVDTYPDDGLWAEAYFQIAFIQPYPDDVATFTAFADAAPAAPEAPDALYRAARLRERNNDFQGAVALWNRLAADYPASAQAPDAAMQAGLVLYRAHDYGAAGLRFELAQALAADPADQARAALWIGKVKQALGDDDGARAAWTAAAALGPHGYYALRARQLLAGQPPFWPPARYSFSSDQAAERAEAEAWLRATFPLAQSVTNLSDLQPGVWQEARFVRGAALWKLGRWQEAHAEFDSLRLALNGDPLATWQLAVYFHTLGAYDLAIRAARQVVDLAGVADSLQAPSYLLRLRYPAPFSRQVVSAANTYGVHPFVMYAKMRIESFFWKFSYSVAEARGLNQFIPPTANDVAAQLGLTDFVLDDLYRPAVSIPMGAYYLNYIAQQTGGGPEAMLAGYYAGPGNADIWLDLAQGDVDLFVEVIRLPDAQGYVTTTFEYFEEYRALYGQ
ncbi:MAG: tetratricopeptide repeat protein [Anaerolineales bacterium]|nr:tetratricopeptide repeat protein [Anaerolineales bacterium]